jgi:hypothetical protein
MDPRSGRARALRHLAAFVVVAVTLVTVLATRPEGGSWLGRRAVEGFGQLEHLPANATVAEAGAQGEIPSGGSAVAHHKDARPVDADEVGPLPQARLYLTGMQAGEPTLGVDEDGNVFYQSMNLEYPASRYMPYVTRSGDEGQTWEDVTPRVPGDLATIYVNTLDPMLYVDERTGRVFTVQLTTGNCSLVSFSDDKGVSWTTSSACGPTDHQHVFAGPPRTSETIGYPNIVYYCAIDGGALAEFGTMTSCLKSLDGGLTWVRTGTPPYHDDPAAGEGFHGIDGHCGGATGHGVVDGEGIIYLPRGYCARPSLAISDDEGLTWKTVQVASNGMPSDADLQETRTGVAVDEAGNLYYTWPGRDRLPYLATSTDGGATWSEPMMVGPPGLTEGTLTEIDVSEPGHVAIAYIGSENAPGGVGADGSGPEYNGATWNGYLTVTEDALSEDPIFYTASVNDRSDPLARGGCGIFRCAQVLDFIDVVIGPDGSAWTSMVDGCPGATQTCPNVGLGIVGRLVGGPIFWG